MTIKKLRSSVQMTQKQFSEYLNIPQRTIESWGSRKQEAARLCN